MSILTFVAVNIEDNPLKLTCAERNNWETINKLLNELAEIFPNLHEQEGFLILFKSGFSKEKAKFPQTHSSWTESSTIEEPLVSLSDKIWKVCWNQELEDLFVTKIANERMNLQNQFEV